MPSLPGTAPTQSWQENQNEAAKMQDVLLILEHLVNREEATVNVILDCLYEIGYVNLINHHVAPPALRRPLKAIARISQPTFRRLGRYWFKRNCPQLIANWLHSLVLFDGKGTPPSEDLQQREIQHLKGQIRWLQGALLGVMLAWGGTTLWVHQGTHGHHLFPTTVPAQSRDGSPGNSI